MSRVVVAMVIVLLSAGVAAAQYEYVPAPVVTPVVPAPVPVVVPAPVPAVTYYSPVVPVYPRPAYVVAPGPVVYGGRYVVRSRYYPYAYPYPARVVVRGW